MDPAGNLGAADRSPGETEGSVGEKAARPWRAHRGDYMQKAVHQLFIVAPVYALFVICLLAWPPGLAVHVGRHTRIYIEHLQYPSFRLVISR